MVIKTTLKNLYKIKKITYIRSSYTVLLINIMSNVFAVLFNLIVSNYIMQETVGAYFYLYSIIIILSQINRLGVDNIVLRRTSGDDLSHDSMNNVLISSFTLITITTVIILAFLKFFQNHIPADVILVAFNREVFDWLLLFIFLHSIRIVLSEALRGQRLNLSSLFINNFGYISIMSLIILPLYEQYSSIGILYSILISNLTLLLFGTYKWFSNIKFSFGGLKFDLRELIRSSIPFLLSTLAFNLITSIDIILLGYFQSSNEVAIYSISLNIASLSNFFLTAQNFIIASYIAEYYRKSDYETLEKFLRLITTFSFILSLPIFLLFLTFPESIIAFFGESYSYGSSLIRIFSLGFLVNVFSGSIGFLLAMTNYEKAIRNISLIVLLITFVKSYIFIAYFGVIGAVISYSISIVLLNIIPVTYAKVRLNIITVPFFSFKDFNSAIKAAFEGTEKNEE
ncbi:MAG: oligosaccharide flippase family protein [Candidatus Hodarchaeota archaeon]